MIHILERGTARQSTKNRNRRQINKREKYLNKLDKLEDFFGEESSINLRLESNRDLSRNGDDSAGGSWVTKYFNRSVSPQLTDCAYQLNFPTQFTTKPRPNFPTSPSNATPKNATSKSCDFSATLLLLRRRIPLVAHISTVVFVCKSINRSNEESPSSPFNGLRSITREDIHYCLVYFIAWFSLSVMFVERRGKSFWENDDAIKRWTRVFRLFRLTRQKCNSFIRSLKRWRGPRRKEKPYEEATQPHGLCCLTETFKGAKNGEIEINYRWV